MGFHAMAVRRNMLMNRATLMACTLAAGIACAQGQGAYPFKPIRIIVPYASGGGPDFTGREIARAITEGTGQPVVMDNRPGAGATLGHGIGAKAAPDGYTLTLGTIGGLVTGPALLGSRIPYDPVKDFTPIGFATYVPYCLVVNAKLGVNNVRELIAYARSSPAKLNFSSPGVGTPNHLGGAMLTTLTGIELLHVPYKMAAQSLSDLISGTIQLSVSGLMNTVPHEKAGRLKILGVGHTHRIKWLPDLPAVNETIPGYYTTGWWGLVGPAGLPKPIVDKLNPIMNKWLQLPETIQRFQAGGLEIATTTPQGYADMIRNDTQMWRKLIKDTKISVDSLP
jgi:tripartite-type tricarboxylate transporter receptor subunit TctC